MDAHVSRAWLLRRSDTMNENQQGRHGKQLAFPPKAVAHGGNVVLSQAAGAQSGDAHGYDTGRMAEIVATLNGTPMDVAHLSANPTRARRGASTLLAIGAFAVAAGAGLFAFEASQDWGAWHAADLKAAQADAPKPAIPGWGTGGLGLGLALLGICPLIAGALRLREQDRSVYDIGEGHNVRFHVPGADLASAESFPLVARRDGKIEVAIVPGMQVSVRDSEGVADAAQLLARGQARLEGGATIIPLRPDARVKVVHGDVTFHVRDVKPEAAVLGRREIDWPVLGHVAGVAAIAVVGYQLSAMIPAEMLSSMMAEDMSSSARFVGFMSQPDQIEEQEPEQAELSEDQDGGADAGSRHMGEEGAAGKPNAVKSQGRMALRKTSDAPPQLSRTFDPDRVAREQGILGALAASNGSFIASPHGGAFQVGMDDSDVWGQLTGSEIGEGPGVGGLGLVGNNHGGGGTAEGLVGLSNTGLIGHSSCPPGAKCEGGSRYNRPSGTGFGDHKAVKPVLRMAKPDVTGAMDKDIIRRIVRAHINEVRACYNVGLNKDPSLAGRVSVNFAIMGTGKVSVANVSEDTLKDSAVGKCIASAVKRWTFPRPEGGANIIVTYPFVLSVG